MDNAAKKAAPVRDWRLPLVIGLGVGLALPVSRSVGSALEPGLGYGWAFAISLAAAGAVGALVALGASWFIKPSGEGRG